MRPPSATDYVPFRGIIDLVHHSSSADERYYTRFSECVCSFFAKRTFILQVRNRF